MNEPAKLLRNLPSVDEIARRLASVQQVHAQPRIVDAVRQVIHSVREEILAGTWQRGEVNSEELLARAKERLEHVGRPPLRPAVNATGIIIHTGLGRAPLAREAVDAMAAAALHYAPVELETATGERGNRSQIVRALLCRMTGAESATVVNNNAAALLIVLATLATDRSVIVSRGELIEIGGSFRLPEVMRAGGAVLREVGTTNKTRIEDYRQAIGPSTAAILRVHPSNYRIAGFTHQPALDELVSLGREHGIVVIDDIGSGLLRSVDHPSLRDEPDARRSIAAGSDLVLFSGDKLLGGPQAGIILGRADLIDMIEKNPLMRALRVDKLTLAALGVTLQLHEVGEVAAEQVPVHAMMRCSVAELRARADRIVAAIHDQAVDAAESESFLGGGSVPARSTPSVAVRLRAGDRSEQTLAESLRRHEPAIISRVSGGAVWLDLRTVFPEQDEILISAIVAALGA